MFCFFAWGVLLYLILFRSFIMSEISASTFSFFFYSSSFFPSSFFSVYFFVHFLFLVVFLSVAIYFNHFIISLAYSLQLL